ncbi:MAG TPA: sugar ABC transporter permease [Chthoniobacterales bacterium]|nr:sugar ABC transporter permease [Chthoniobacterales bacterium]
MKVQELQDVSRTVRGTKKGFQATWRSFSQAAFGYVLLAPALIIILGLNLYPTISGVVTSFTNQSLLDPYHWAYVGFENYQKLVNDPVFRISFIHSLVLTCLAVGLQVILGLILAQLLIQKVPGIHFFRSIGMIAWVLPIIASVVMFRFITLPNYGFINIVLTDLGLGRFARNWFGDQTYAFVLVLIMHLWRNVPFYAISFMAAMQSISNDVYEAARIDGTSSWRQFFHITLPNLRYIILVMVVLHVTFTFNNFDFVYLSTGGGPVNATEVLPTYIYKQAWNGYALGYASAGGVIMLIVLLLLVFGCRKLIGGFSEP